VLGEKKSAVGPEHPPDFCKRRSRVVDAAQSEGYDGRIDAAILYRQGFTGAAQELDQRFAR
jgi:hypothetical protein